MTHKPMATSTISPMPADIGDAAAFLASDEARFISGAVLTADSGILARMSLGMNSQGDVLAGMLEIKQEERKGSSA